MKYLIILFDQIQPSLNCHCCHQLHPARMRSPPCLVLNAICWVPLVWVALHTPLRPNTHTVLPPLAWYSSHADLALTFHSDTVVPPQPHCADASLNVNVFHLTALGLTCLGRKVEEERKWNHFSVDKSCIHTVNIKCPLLIGKLLLNPDFLNVLKHH